MPSFQKNKSSVKKAGKCKMFPLRSNMTLLIVESPSKCATIMKYLGDGYRCVATCGHMRYLDGLSAIDVSKNYKLKFTVMDSKRAQITRISSEIKMATRIIVATDDDREGESIAWHICDMFHLPIDTTERIVFHEITKDALEKAMVTPRNVNMNIVTSAHARQILDLFIGYKISPFIWKHISSTGLSAGRCQTPALRLVYDNQREIENRLLINENNKSNENGFEYAVCGYFTKLNIPFSLEKRFKSFFLEEEGERELELETFLRNSISSRHVFMCVDKDTDVHRLSPPLPFSTSRLQQTASNELSMSPSETMQICQTLYESGCITYIRTTGKSYSAEFVGEANNYVREKWGEKYIKCDDDKGVAKVGIDAHEAIRPTDITRISLTNDYHALEQKMYKLIWKNALENCMSDYTFLPMVAKINVITGTGTGTEHTYKFACQKPVFLGWKAVQGFTPEQQRHHTMMDYLHNIRENSIIPYNKIETSITITSHVGAHYTEARLIQELEEREIGRPSTYSTIIEKIVEREYVKKQNVVGKRIEYDEYTLVDKIVSKTKSWREVGNEKNKLIITPIGKSVLEFLTSHFPILFSYDYTKHMEMRLDDIAVPPVKSGGDPMHELKIVCDECVGEIEECINQIKKLKKDETQYRIDDYHIFIIGKHGPVVIYSDKPFSKGEEAFDKYLNDSFNSGENENIIFKKVKPGIIFDDLKTGKYTNLSDIIVEDSSLERIVGTYGGLNVILKNGRFGIYVVWGKNGENRKSFKCGKNISDISLEEVIRHIENDSNDSARIDGVATTTIGDVTDIIRIVNDDISIRKGNYGNYIFYKTAKMKKPKFISLKTFKLDYNKCSLNDITSWVKSNI
uniref:DNA topoisomerase n=1 Tax=viral metagenome TaxID=1070528 RepID=A0A6C0F1Y0_9ZZZZ